MTVDKYDLISYDELHSATENDLNENKFKTSAEFLISAITDWPTFNLQEPKDLIAELNNEIKGKLNFENIEHYLKGLNTNNDLWKIEAATALLKMFDLEPEAKYDNSIDLEIIIEKLTQHYRQK